MKEQRSNLILTQALLVSGGLNVFFIGLFFFMIVQDAPLYFNFRQVKASSAQAKEADSSSSHLVATLHGASFEQLVDALNDKTLVEDGFKARDFALSLLVQEHHFDLHRAILGMSEPKQKRTLKIASIDHQAFRTLHLFADLTDRHYHSILDFARQEKWPLTAEGLFINLKKSSDPTLTQAFLLSAPFSQLSALFNEKPQELLPMVLEQDWSLFHAFLNYSSESESSRQFFLRTYFEKGSKKAHDLLLAYESSYALKKFDDASLAKLLQTDSPSVTPFAESILASPRNDDLQKKAKAIVPQSLMKTPQKIHVVQDGESLWRISRIHQADVALLKELNNLRSDQIHPGQTLLIP